MLTAVTTARDPQLNAYMLHDMQVTWKLQDTGKKRTGRSKYSSFGNYNNVNYFFRESFFDGIDKFTVSKLELVGTLSTMEIIAETRCMIIFRSLSRVAMFITSCIF